MEKVFEASSGLEAHLIRDLLERAGVPSRIDGEYLTGAMGELPMGSLVSVRVAPEHVAEAREIIADWEKQQAPASASPAPPAISRKTSWAPFTFLIGGTLGLFAGWWFYNTPVTSDGIDYDGDGRFEESWFYSGQKTRLVEYDRNADGHADIQYRYDTNGLVKDASFDEDFDRRFETYSELVRGQPEFSKTDLDGDGFEEILAWFRNGIATEVHYLSPTSRAVIKRERYGAGGVLVSADFDADGDGKFERHVEYDAIGEPKRGDSF
jgi:hypothetical protein